MAPQLCLGTAQFGLPYGITNNLGQVDERVVRKLLSKAFDHGITCLDTAHVYGTAEQVLGRNLPNGCPFRIVTKLSSQTQSSFSVDDVEIWDTAFSRSCFLLGQHKIDSLLLHDINDLNKPGSQHLVKWMLNLREKGLVKRLGVSIYRAEDLDGISSDLLDLVQLPLSLYDQRLLCDGTIARLKSQGCAVHARSLYLQGLLLSKSCDLPSWVSQSTRDHHTKLEALAADRGCSLLDLSLSFAKVQSDLESVVIGVCSLNQLDQLLHSWEHALSPWQNAEWHNWALDSLDLIDPRRWPKH